MTTETSESNGTMPQTGMSAEEREAAFASPIKAHRRTFRIAVAVILLMLVGGGLVGEAINYAGSRATKPSKPNSGLLATPVGRGNTETSPLAAYMGLSPVKPELAPGFSLLDQSGHQVSLSQFRHKVVVLDFMDSVCTDICPIISQEFVDAHNDLGAKASKVVFMAVNVNAAHNSVAAVHTYTAEHGMATLSDWYFLTGTPAQLSKVWKDYGVTVYRQGNTLVHSDQLYFIGPSGHERYLATPYADQHPNGTATLPAASIAQWGRGIAHYAGSLES